ncbi:GNAT family N-acetyltransferase [Geodermatophilus sp. URMC 62]|uniref:GNAT family N-acetyltransferase n=1 Tax=Geodermatophilus sp. URMC 62 TaxID=3423414 RepID=UPI00406D3BF6
MTAPLARLTGAAEGVLLRRATAADLPAVVALLADDPIAAGRETTDLAPYEAAFAAVDADPAHLLVVAEDGGTVVGTLQLTVIPGLARGGTLRAQVEGVRVAAALRRRGLGAAVLAWVADEARRRGATLVQLTTDKRRTDAHRFYERLGYVASHEGFELEL